MDSKALREKRKKLAEDANAILTRAVNEGRAATPEELQTVDKIHADVDALKSTIERVERADTEARMYAPESQREERGGPSADEQEVRTRAFRNWSLGGPSALSSEELRALNPKPSGNGTEITLRFMSKDERRQYERNEREQRAQTVTTSAGGGDKVRYFPYRDMEPGLYKALSDTFREVTMVRDLGGLDKLRTEGKALLITPTITTQSSSESIVTWPPTQFTVELSCKVTDAAGKTVDTVNVSGQGRATFDEFKGNFSLAATRASTDALTKLVKALGESASLRSQ